MVEQVVTAVAEEEAKNAKMLDFAFYLAIASVVCFFVLVMVFGLALKNRKFAFGVVVVLLLAGLFVGIFGAYRIEVTTGYYCCENCQQKFTPDPDTAIWCPKYGSPRNLKRYLECPECNEKTWAQKVLTK